MGTFADWARFAQTPLGNVCLAWPSQPRQKHVVNLALLSPGLVEKVIAQLLVAKFFQDFAFLPCQLVRL